MPRYSGGMGQPEGNLRGPVALICMENFEHKQKPPITKAEREAKKEKSQLEAKQALAERKKADDAFRANFERLKAERKAREELANDGGTPSSS
jgi:hypothetical protein